MQSAFVKAETSYQGKDFVHTNIKLAYIYFLGWDNSLRSTQDEDNMIL